MQIAWEKVLPVLISIAILIAVAIFRNTSRTFATIAATMPIQMPLTLYIVHSGTNISGAGEHEALLAFIEGLIIGLFATFVFICAVYVAARSGSSLIGMLLVGYAAWAVTLLIINAARTLLGR